MIVNRKQVSAYVRLRLIQISEAPDRLAKASLARLRRGIGKKPGELPELWGDFLQDMPEVFYSDFVSAFGSPSCAEWAAYIALTLYALHQQGRAVDTESVQQDGRSLGMAAAELVKDEEDMERIWRRFCKVAAADDMAELSYYLRGMVQLFRANGIGLDYVKLAGDLYDYQFPDRADRIRLRWGEDFYRSRKKEGETEDESESVS